MKEEEERYWANKQGRREGEKSHSSDRAGLGVCFSCVIGVEVGVLGVGVVGRGVVRVRMGVEVGVGFGVGAVGVV